MSKTIIIQKNGAAQTLTVDKLRLPDAAGGTEDWLPADGKNLVNLEVKQNGTYRASDFSAYGIAEVKVKCTLNGGAATPKATEKLLNALHHPAPAEGGRARTMSAHHLETPQDGGGTVPWVPEEEVALGTKSVNVDNRTYKASDDGKYGWSQFIVSGISITKDGDTITHTDGTGTKTYTLPDHIDITLLPLKISYSDGEMLDFAGMEVKAYLRDNRLWTDEYHPNGIIPLDELTMSPTVAHNDGTIIGSEDDAYILPDGMIVYGFAMTKYGDCYQWRERSLAISSTFYTPYYLTADAPCSGLLVKYPWPMYFYYITSGNPTNIGNRVESTEAFPSNPDQIPQRKWKVFSFGWMYGNDDLTTSPVAPEVDSGDDYGLQLGMNVTASWNRPFDEETLTDDFQVLVAPNTVGQDDLQGGGGQTSGGGAGRDN